MLLSEQITLMSDQNHFCSDNVSWHIYCLFQALWEHTICVPVALKVQVP